MYSLRQTVHHLRSCGKSAFNGHKNDGRRAVFDKEKLLKGIIRSCYKRDIPAEK